VLFSKKLLSICVVAGSLVLISGCSKSTASTTTSSGSTSGSASGTPITFGSLDVSSGAPIKLTATRGILAYFAAWNARGGWHNHPLKLDIANGGLTAPGASQAAHQLVGGQNVVGMVGNVAVMDCVANRDYYKASGVAAIGPAFSTDCFSTPPLFPLSSQVAVTPVFKWVVQKYAGKKLAFISADVPEDRSSNQISTKYLESHGVKVVSTSYVPFGAADLTAPIIAAKQAGAQVIFTALDAPTLGAALKVADLQGMGIKNGVAWVTAGALYDPKVPGVLGPVGNGLYIGAAIDPYESGTPDIKTFLNAFSKEYPGQVPDTTDAAGWISAAAVEQVLQSVKGTTLTRQSFEAALSGAKDLRLPLLPPSAVSFIPHHYPNATKVVEIKNGKFVVISGWIELNDPNAP
jgi:ABC-type branched-subunit amino acid transport system substrate-binding protein